MAIMNFFRPHWKNSKPEIRAASLRSLEDDRQEVFLSVTLEDVDPALRLMASKRLLRESELRQALEKSTDKGVQEVARKTLNQVLTEKIKSMGISQLAEAQQGLSELGTDTKALETIACGAALSEIRREALALITHASSILAVALKEEVPTIALLALKRLTREAQIQSVAKSASSKEVRAAAKERLKVLENAKKPDVMAINRAKLKLILAVAEKAEAGTAEVNPAFDWSSTLEQIEHAEHSLYELLESGLPLEDHEASLFHDRVTTFRNRHTRHQAAEIGRAEREEREKASREIKLELCARMELLYADSKVVDAGEVEDLTRRFNAAGSSGDEDGLRDRFRLAKDRVIKEKLSKQREEENVERRKLEAEAQQNEAEAEQARQQVLLQKAETWKTHAPMLTEWMYELETLAESADLKHAEKRLREIQSRWKGMLAYAPEQEAAKMMLRYYAAADHLREVLEWNRWSNLQRKLEICTQLEALVLLEDRKSMVVRFKEIIAEWKTIGPVSWDSTETVWDRYHQACDALYEKLKEYFAELDVERESNAKAKEDLCTKLETILATPDADMREATEAFKEAQSAWKALGAVPREKSEALWNRFRAACKAFYGRIDQQYQENLKQKLELATLVESLKNSTEWKNTAAQIKEAQERWKSIGPVPRDQAEALWQRFHGASETFFSARKSFFEKLDQDRPVNLEKKTALCDQIEKLDELQSDEQKYQLILDVQAQWKEIGPVPRENEDAIWERFRKPIDAYFQERKQRMHAERGTRDENAKAKEDLCTEAESLRDSTEWKATIDKIKTLQVRWKTIGPTFRELDQALWQRFRSACDTFFDHLKEYSAQRDQERDGNLLKKINICFTVEILSGLTPEDETERTAREAWIEAQRAAGNSVPEFLADWNKGTDRVKYFQLEWKKIGPVPREKNELIWDRFQRACDVFFEERRRAQGHPGEDPQHNLEGKLALIASAEELAHTPGSQNENKINELFRQWKRIGPVPRAQSDYVWERFSTACDTAVGRVTERA